MSDLRIVVLDAFAADQGEAAAWDDLRKLGQVAIHARTPAGRVIDACRDADAVITNKAPLSTEIIAALPRLR